MISTHTQHKNTEEKYTHEVKSKKKQDAVSSWSKLAKKKQTRSREEDKKQYLPSSSSQVPAYPRPLAHPLPLPLIRLRKLLARTNPAHLRNAWETTENERAKPERKKKQNCTKRKSLARNAITLTHTNTHVNILKEKQTAYIFSVRE